MFSSLECLIHGSCRLYRRRNRVKEESVTFSAVHLMFSKYNLKKKYLKKLNVIRLFYSKEIWFFFLKYVSRKALCFDIANNFSVIGNFFNLPTISNNQINGTWYVTLKLYQKRFLLLNSFLPVNWLQPSSVSER